MRHNYQWGAVLSAVIVVMLLAASQGVSEARAAVIPAMYDVVTLPNPSQVSSQNQSQNQPEVDHFNAFTAINNNGLAVGYGNRNNHSVGFVFDYRSQAVIALIDDFLPMSINDYNKIAGIYASQSNNAVLATCILNDASCEVIPVEGAEFALPFTVTAMTNSGLLAAKQWLNTPDEQFLLYRQGQLVYNALTTDSNGANQTFYDIQRNNTRLITGAVTDANGLRTPLVTLINPDLAVTALNLPVPGLDGGAGSGTAVAVNAMNQIVISTINGSTEGQLYVCDFIGDVDDDGLGDCQHGLRFLGPNADVNNPYARYPLNDHGLLVVPPAYHGDGIRLYDLTAEHPVAELLSDKGYPASLFANTQPLAVNNHQVILTSGAQTVLLVPQAATPDIQVQIHHDMAPVVVAADGSDRLYLTESISNLSLTSHTILYWRVLILPDGTAYPRSTPKRLILEAGGSYTDTRVRLRVPEYFPPGNYVYQLIAIDQSSGERYSETLQIIKAPQ
ncbi:MAG: hypothetical protein LJE85_09195 [Gammaproteobacteria bacterium]|nr:hypothetical protein [Gammaproteobacteria bacterium]